MIAISSAVKSLSYVLRTLSVVAGLMMIFGIVWFVGELAGSPSLWLELAAGLAAVMLGLVPFPLSGKWVRASGVCLLVVLVNLVFLAWGVTTGQHDTEVLFWPTLSMLVATALLGIGRQASSHRS